jgi:two-component system, sensor histidine kinase LadS
MMLIMIVLSVIALAVIKQGVFETYIGYLLSRLIYVSHVDSVAFQYLWPNFPRFNSMASIIAGCDVIVCACLFAITYLQTKRPHPVMHRFLASYVALFHVLVGFLWATDLLTLKRVLVVLLSISTLICFSAGVVAARKRLNEGKFYLFACCAALIQAVLLTARFAFGFEPSFIGTYNAVRLALIVDALMMGMAIIYRYNYLRQTAIEESLTQAQRNLSLSQRLGVLVGQYERVTTQSMCCEGD